MSEMRQPTGDDGAARQTAREAARRGAERPVRSTMPLPRSQVLSVTALDGGKRLDECAAHAGEQRNAQTTPS